MCQRPKSAAILLLIVLAIAAACDSERDRVDKNGDKTCRETLRQFGIELKKFAADSGSFPDAEQALKLANEAGFKLICPGSNDWIATVSDASAIRIGSYIYLGGGRSSGDNVFVLALEREYNHYIDEKIRVHILLSDGTVLTAE